MNFQKYHVSKNLFDKNNYLEFNGYFNKLSGTITILYESNNKIVYIPCKPNTTYTASRIAGKRFAVGCSVDVPSNGVTVYDVDGSASGATSLTVTTTADAKYLVAYIRNGNIAGESSLTDIIDSLQIEEGKAATPYEPYGNTWNLIPYYIRKTATDNITSLPTTIYGDGTNASMTIKGNTVQNGTPSPSNPVTVSGVGERTENFFNVANVVQQPNIISVSGTTIIKANNTSYNIDILSGTSGAGTAMSNKSLVLEAGTYTLSCNIVTGAINMFLIVACPYTSTTLEPVDQYFDGHNGKSFTLAEKSYVSLRIQQNTAVEVKDIMITRGSQSPTSYIPWGYKIPISSGSTTTNVYLGEVETTRKIKKLVFDGTEDWTKSRNDDTAFFKLQLSDYKLQTVAFCSHFEYANVTQSGTTLGFYIVLGSGMIRIRPENVATTTLESFLSFLSTQYSNGTPVTIYYVLDTPETIISNEPLYKIDNYSDSISASIPTTDGANILDIPTILQPSSVDVNYHGWHIADAHEYHVSTNLIDCEIEDGGYSAATGKKTSGNYYRTADYIAVEPNTDYVFGRGGVNIAVYVCLYTSDKTFIERLYPRSGEYFTTSESTYYITLYRSNIETSEQWQLNLGESSLPYEAYFEPYWE